MRKTLLITFMTLALAFMTWSGNAHGVVRYVPGDCCEEMCEDMAACATMIVCQACSVNMATLPSTEVWVRAYQPTFPMPHQDRVHKDAARPIWTPPD